MKLVPIQVSNVRKIPSSDVVIWTDSCGVRHPESKLSKILERLNLGYIQPQQARPGRAKVKGDVQLCEGSGTR
jgi:hypothetical protein